MSNSFSNPTQVTISLLPASLSLVHIPRSRLGAHIFHPILRQILHPNSTFLNITCNEIELSLFAEHQVLADFEPIARRDRARQRSRSGSGSMRRNPNPGNSEPVEVSYEKWNVLQIDSHSDQLDNSGARVRELSTPLAAAGISILYQSSYMCDFIFVKETRLLEVMSLLASAGFDPYSSDPNLLTSRMVSPLLSPTAQDETSSMMDIGLADTHMESGTVVTPARNRSLANQDRNVHPEDEPKTEPPTVPPDPTQPVSASPVRSKSHSPTSGEVRVLSSDLTCVGLSNDNVDHWGLKIIKLVAFPELIAISESETSTPARPKAFDDFHGVSESPAVGLFSASISGARGRRVTMEDSSASSSDEDGYFSHSPERSSSLVTSASRSSPDLIRSSNISRSLNSSSKHSIPPLAPLDASNSRSDLSMTSPTADTGQGTDSKVPFFSFTRTSEGSSLTTDVSLLAALFPPNERHMVICSGELDAVDGQSASPGFVDFDEDEDIQGGTLKCLQIDLRRFGLDKHGLVNRFSRVLEENNINHMYSSTFKTANLLVDKVHAGHAQMLLRTC